jgi:VanZ family protein
MSGDSNSGQKSDFITTLIFKFFNLLFFLPLNKIDTNLIGFFIRKIAHISEYFILTFFFYIGFYKNFIKISKTNILLLSLFLSISYSITDEIHQTYVPNRVGSYKDVIIDSIGAIIFYFLLRKNTKIKDNN